MNYAASILGHGRDQEGPVEVNGVSSPIQVGLNDVIADFAIEWRQQNRDHRFLMVAGFKRPHRLGDVPTLFAVRTTTRKRVKCPNRPEETEVFDLAADPYEIKNVAADAALTAKLEAELDRLVKAVNDSVPLDAGKSRGAVRQSAEPGSAR